MLLAATCQGSSPVLLEAVAAMDQELPRLLFAGHLDIDEEGYVRLIRVSPSTLDRIRARRRVPGRRLRGGTKPSSLPKKQIPIRAFADWDDKRVGFVEIDLDQHDGGNSSGIFARRLNATDVSAGWCEPIAIENKAQTRVVDALLRVRRRLPFPPLGIDSDNGRSSSTPSYTSIADSMNSTLPRAESDARVTTPTSNRRISP